LSSLKKKSTTAILWDLVGKLSTQGIGFIISIFLAHFLAPEEFGLIGMALAFIWLSQNLMDVGLSSALVQSRDNDALTYSSVFYLNLAVGIFFF